MEPLLPPLQRIFTCCVVTVGVFGASTVTAVLVVQPFASVTVTLYVPPTKLVKSSGSFVLGTICPQSKVYGNVPPNAVMLIVPFGNPQVDGVDVPETVN